MENNKNLRNAPKATEYSELQAQRGTGQLNSVNAYLRNDPVSYFYQKFKDSGNEFLRDDFWSEASKRGESDNLIGLLSMTGDEKFSRKAYDALSGYGDAMDYDAYMLALQLPHLDNETKVDRVDEATGTEFGSFTEQEWAWEILNHMTMRWDAEIIEADKANRGFLANAGTQVVAGLTNIVGGAFQFVGDIWNLGEGLLNVLVNWNNDSGKGFLANRGEKFLGAFDDENFVDNPFGNIGEWLSAASFEFQRKYATTVNAVAALDQGYELGEGSNFIEQINNASGVGTGYTTWGRWMNAGTNAIGYMVPTIVVGVLTAGSASAATAAGKTASVGVKVAAGVNKARSGIFYAGIFSGMVKDTVATNKLNGITYKDLNAGQVLSNALIKSAAQYAVEFGLGMVLGFSGVDRLIGISGKTTSKATSSVTTGVTAGVGKAGAQAIGRGLKAAGKEGLEETLQELSDSVINYAFGGNFREQAIQNFSLQTLTDAFVIGALTSVVMGSVANIKVLTGLDREVGTTKTGELFTLGAFQTLNLRQAMETMHSLRNTVEDSEANPEKRAQAMLALNASIATLGDVYRNMGTERAIKADAVIMDILNLETKAEQVKALDIEGKYTTKLWENFMETHATAVNANIAAKARKALDKQEAKLKKNNVTKIQDIVTATTETTDLQVGTSKEALDRVKQILNKMGVEAVLGVDGNIVTKSDEIVFVPADLITKGDIETIISGLAYDLVLTTVNSKLTPAQKKLITTTYSQITGQAESLEMAIMALLFDKNFYTHTLLKMQEGRRYKNPAFEILATIDQLLKAKLTPNIGNGTITEKAYKTLMAKVQKTMQSGLVTFATQHQRIDLGLVDNAVLPIELKNYIRNHKNVRFSEMIDDGIKSAKNLDFDRIQAFDEAIEKFASYITKEEADDLKAAMRSGDYNKRVDAYITLTYLAKSYNTADKTIYLPAFETSSDNFSIIEAVHQTSEQFGVPWNDLIQGNYDVNDLTPEISDFIVANGYIMSIPESRYAAIRHVLFNKSGKTLTLGNNGVVLRVISKADLLKPKYKGAEGEQQLYEDLKSGTVTTLKDISDMDLDPVVGNLKLTLDPSLQAGLNGGHIDGSNELLLSGRDLVNTIMHEATHVTQTMFETDSDYISGGTSDMFSLLPVKVKKSLTDYIKTNFPLAYNMIKNPSNNNASIMYFMLGGEIQANTTLSSLMFETGFKWKNNRTILVSPDGTQEWSMTPTKRRVTKIAEDIGKQAVDKAKEVSSEDKPVAKRKKDDSLPKWKGPKPQSNINKSTDILTQAKDFYAKWPILKDVAESELHNLKLTPEMVKAIEDARLTSLQRLYNEMYKEEFDGTYAQFLKTPIYFANTAADKIDFDAARDLMPVYVGYDPETITMQIRSAGVVDPNLKQGYLKQVYTDNITVGQITPFDLEIYLPQAGTSALMKPKTIQRYGTMVKANLEQQGARIDFDTSKARERLTELASTTDTLYNSPVTKYDPNDPTTSPLPKGLSADEPITARALAAIRDDKSNQDYVKNAYLKREDGTPILFYRGWTSLHKNSEIHLAIEGNIPVGIKGGEFYSTSPDVSKIFGSRLDGFITNFTREEIREYQFDGADWLLLKGFYTPKDLELHKKIYDISRPFATTIAVANVMSLGRSIEPYVVARLSKQDLALWNSTIENLMTEHGVSRDNAVTVVAIGSRWKDNYTYRTDELIPVNMLQGYKAILMVDINEAVGGKPTIATNLVVLRGNKVKRITHSEKDINWDKIIKPEATRYISNQIAKKSNLKYFIRKGVPIQLDPRVASFVSNTTQNFDKLPIVIKNKILKGDLNRFDLIDFVATAKSMNDYTFKAIAKYVYDNEELSRLTFKEVSDLMDDVSDIAALAEVVETADTVRSPMEMTNLLKVINRKANNNPELMAKLIKARTNALRVKLIGKYGENFSKGKIRDSFVDPTQLMPIIMRHYDGTLNSMRHINNFGKLLTTLQEGLELNENVDTGKISTSTKAWNWIDNMRKADIDYEYDTDIKDTLNDLDRDDKIDAIKDYITNQLIARVKTMSQAEKVAQAASLQAELTSSIQGLEALSDDAINARYLAVIANETSSPKDRTTISVTEQDIATQPRSTKNIKDHLRQSARTVTRRIAGLKRRYNMLPIEVKEALDPKTYKLRREYYTKMTDDQLEDLLSNMQEGAKILNTNIKAAEIKAKTIAKTEERIKKLAQRELQTKPKKTTLREKLKVVHKTTIVNQVFSFDSREQPTKTAETLLDTQWNKRTMSQVKGLTNNVEQNVHNGKTFFENNAKTLMDMSVADAEATAKWFIDTNIVGIPSDSSEVQTFAAIKTYFLGYIISQAKDGGQFYGFNPNLLARIQNHLKTQISTAGTALAVWNNIKGLINPVETMLNASMEIAGVLITDAEKEALALAAVNGDMDAIAKARQDIIDRVNLEKTTKKTVWRKVTMLRSMSMLSNPVTWLRNIMSNKLLKELNQISSKIGNKIASNKTSKGQFKMDGVITPEIQAFINNHFIDNKMFEVLVSNLSRYNPSDIQARFKDATGKANKDAIFANMVIKSLYNEYYNQNLFDSARLNQVHKFLMKMLSDNNYVREAAVRYFGKILAERSYDLNKGVSDAIMNDFANAIGMAMADYMHSDNFFNQFETILAERSEAALFAYKLILPFGSASWNWFKAAMRFSPVGLGQSIYKLAKLEQEIIKAEEQWAKGKGQVSPELTEYLIRRNLGSGIIGTTSLLFGMMLAGLGYVELEEEDYGVPKLRIGNLRIDVSTIFGSSSVLAGMALVKGWEKGDYMAAIDAMLDPMLDGFFLVQILEMDKYNNEGWASLGVNFMEQTLLSFIPNGIRWISGATYTGKYKTNTFFQRAVSRIPFFGTVFGLEKRVNPYSGDKGDAWDMFNRVVPFFEVRRTSFMEDNSKALGINKAELRGKYEINGEKFELSTADVAALNRAYGQWNADALTSFYSGESRHNVKDEKGNFRMLTYNQMTEKQRRNTVANIFTKNAEYAKISAWLAAGNIYYASTTDYVELKKLGVTGTLYKGNRGFVKK